MRSLIGDLIEGFRNPEFWALSAWLDIAVKYRRSRLGMFWLLLPSIVYIWGVGSLFAKLFERPVAEFTAHVAMGWTVFRIMSSVTTESTTVLFGAKAFIMDGHMRLSDFVLRAMAKAGFYFLMTIPAAVAALLVYPDLNWVGGLLSLCAFALILLNTLWVGVIFAVAGARFPDLNQFIGNIFMFLFLLTPIVWYSDRMPADSVRGAAARMNPFYHLIEIFRAPFLGEPLSLYSWYYVAAMTALGWCVAVFVYRRYAQFVPVWL